MVFIEHVGNKTPKQISRMARDRGSGSEYYTQILLEEYNGKRRGNTRVSPRKLYTHTEVLKPKSKEHDELENGVEQAVLFNSFESDQAVDL